MELTIYQVDAFAENLFEGNPAAVIPLEQWLPDKLMLKIGMENNLSETAFFVKNNGQYHIRWFTPVSEVDLCGHATLATAHVLFNHLGYTKKVIEFESRSGLLKVENNDPFLSLDFPVSPLDKINIPANTESFLGTTPTDCFMGIEDMMMVFENESIIINMVPNFSNFPEPVKRGLIVTAPGDEVDFVSRFFAPAVGIDEDPVTGSAHTKLIPYWAKRLGKNVLQARQISQRGGALKCELKGDRVKIGGKAVTFFKATAHI